MGINFKNSKIKIKTTIFSIIAFLFIMAFVFFCTPFMSIGRAASGNQIIIPENGIVPLQLQESFEPEISHYLYAEITATNIGSPENTFSSCLVRWEAGKANTVQEADIQEDGSTDSHKEDNPEESNPEESGLKIQQILNQQRFKINIDGIKHRYYIPLGENRYWKDACAAQEESLSGVPDEPDSDGNNSGYAGSAGAGPATSRSITSVSLEFPGMEGLDIVVTAIALKERIAFPLDIYLNQKLLNIAGETGRNVNPFLTPSYILAAVFLILALIFYLLFRTRYAEKGINMGNILRKAVFIFILAILLMFSASFIYSEAIAVKSHWNTYREYIKTGRLDQTYMGFYDFEKFIFWLDSEIPEGENLIVLVRGEPVYIMSEMAYNLYPRDIKFIDISQKSQQIILDEIDKINEDRDMEYTYVITFTEKDLSNISDLILINKYREDAGFIHKLK